MLFGFALECVDCAPGEGARGRGRSGAPPVWSYRQFPRVLAVLPGSAAEQAGIHQGDILQSIDGMSVLSDSGAQRLAHAVAGDRVRLAFTRDSKPISVSLVLGSSASSKSGSGPTSIISGFAALQGGNLKMEIWSDDPIIVQEPVPDSTGGGVITLRIGSGTVIKLRLKKDSTGRFNN